MSETVISRLLDDSMPPFAAHSGQTSFFGGAPPLSKGAGCLAVVGFGFLFSVFTTAIVCFDKLAKGNATMTSEHFKQVHALIMRVVINLLAALQDEWQR